MRNTTPRRRWPDFTQQTAPDTHTPENTPGHTPGHKPEHTWTNT